MTGAGTRAELSRGEFRQAFYRPELDVLRFAAFLLVFVYHGFPLRSGDYAAKGVPNIFAGLIAAGARTGGLGVDLFFTLSAYLITELLLREQRLHGRFDVRAFYVRRILRIWPLYYFALLVLLPVLALVLPRDTMPASFLAAFLFFAGNWACAWTSLYPSSLALLWSVSIEEQFYLAWPWLLRVSGRFLPLCCGALMAVATITRVYLIAHQATVAAVWTNTLARLDPIAGGALLAFVLHGRVLNHTPFRRALWVAGGGVALWIAGSAIQDPGWVWLVTYPLAAAGCVAILFGVLGMEQRTPAVFRYLGKISYGLYVFHVAAIRVVQSASPALAGPAVLVAALALTVSAAALSYRYLESPFLRRKKHFEYVAAGPV